MPGGGVLPASGCEGRDQGRSLGGPLCFQLGHLGNGHAIHRAGLKVSEVMGLVPNEGIGSKTSKSTWDETGQCSGSSVSAPQRRAYLGYR